MLPSNPNSEVTSRSLVAFPGSAAPSCKPKTSWAMMLILPPEPSLALAIISLPSTRAGKAITNSASILTLPPLALLKALAEI